MGAVATSLWTQPLATFTTSISSGKTTTRDDNGRNPLYGSTGQIGTTNMTEFTGPSILVARVGANAGSVYAVDGSYGVTDNTLVVRPRSNQSVPFLREFLQYIDLNRLVYGSGQPLVTGTMLKRVEVPVLEPAEQLAIADALTEADRHIRSLERLITKKQAIKLGMVQQLVSGRTRLPGFADAWSIGPLKSYFPLQRGFDLPTPQVRPGPYPVVYSNGVARTHEVAMVRGPGVVTGRSGTIGKVHFVEMDYWPHNTSLWVTDSSRADAKFAYYFLSHLGLGRFASGSGVPTLNRNDAHDFEVRVPEDLTEQRAIAKVLASVDKDLARIRARLTKAHSIKQGMMQQLLSGRTRLNVEPAS